MAHLERGEQHGRVVRSYRPQAPLASQFYEQGPVKRYVVSMRAGRRGRVVAERAPPEAEIVIGPRPPAFVSSGATADEALDNAVDAMAERHARMGYSCAFDIVLAP